MDYYKENMNTEHYASLEALIEKLEEIQSNGHGAFSLAQAIYLLAKEIKEIKDLHEKISEALSGENEEFTWKWDSK